MNKSKTALGNYSYSVRTSGEAVRMFVRDKEVICTLVVFITAKVHLFLAPQVSFVVCNKIAADCFFMKKTKNSLNSMFIKEFGGVECDFED